MITHDLIQGSQQWHEYRDSHLNASDAPAMMGCSSYTTRSQLIQQRATGIRPAVDSATKSRFDDGHRFEALARPLADGIVGADLYPQTGSLDEYSASFDGITINEDIGFEHKTLKDELRKVMVDGCKGSDLPLEYQVQMEHQCMVSGCNYILFMASKWERETDELIEMRHCRYEPNLALRKQIVDGWKQFQKDVAEYVHVEVAAPIVAAPIESFPVVIVNVTGALSASNLSLVTPKFDAYLASVNVKPKTDEEFVNCEASGKFMRQVAKSLKAKAQDIVDQNFDVSEAVRITKMYAGYFDAKAIEAEKEVKGGKDVIKAQIIGIARQKFSDHCAILDKRIGRAVMPLIVPNFVEAIKNKRTLVSVQNEVDTLLAKEKIAANEIADRAQLNLDLPEFKENEHLFPDFRTQCLKDPGDFQAIVASRVASYLADIQAKAEKAAADRAAAERYQEQRRVLAEQSQAAEDARNAEFRKAMDNMPMAAPVKELVEQVTITRPTFANPSTVTVPKKNPTVQDMIKVLQIHFDMGRMDILNIFYEADLDLIAEEFATA